MANKLHYKMWACVSPDKTLCFCFADTRKQCIINVMRTWVAHDNMPPGKTKWTWPELYAQGWRLKFFNIDESE